MQYVSPLQPPAMRRFFLYTIFSLIFLQSAGLAQVRPGFLYNPNMPYGTLDIRTEINGKSDYYYLVEGRTFSFRESGPGVPTDTYLKMTNFDTSPFQEGHMRHKKDNDDFFEMNYRLLFPREYQKSYAAGYPLIVLMHGAVERGNCYYEECYHGGWEYDPNTNSPPAPTNKDHKLLNNDHHLTIGAREHLAARNRAGNRLPDDSSMPEQAFPGFVLMPQMFNDWDSLWVEKVLRMVQLHVEEYNIDPNRIYIHGLSIGGYATYEAIKRAPWLFTAALPMSAVSEAAKIFEHNQQDKVSHVPLWVFQGGRDTEPTVGWTKGVVGKFRDVGSSVRYTEYPELGHNVWAKSYAEPDFFSWMLKHNKSDIHPHFQRTEINKSENLFPELLLAEGFFAYQWEKDGQVIPGAASHKFTPMEAGVYRARFSRVASPAANDWNKWSKPVTITRVDEDEEEPDDEKPEDEEEDEQPDDEDQSGEEPGEEQPVDEEPEDDATDNDDGDDQTGNDDGGEDQPTEGDEDDDAAGENDNPDDENPGSDDSDEEEQNDNGDGENNPGENDDDEQHTGTPGEGGDGVITNLPDDQAITVSIYPNPVSSQTVTLDIQNPSGRPFDYVVTDALGRTRTSGQLTGSGESEKIILDSFQTLGDGVYILVLRQGSREIKKRVIIRNP